MGLYTLNLTNDSPLAITIIERCIDVIMIRKKVEETDNKLNIITRTQKEINNNYLI